MVWKLLFLTVAVLMLGSCTANFKDDAEVEHNGSGNGVIDSDDEDLFEGSANDDDEDDIEISGSGLDKGFIGDDTTQPQSTRPFSECEQLRNSIKDPDYARRMKSFVPRCTLDGAFERLQCRGEPGIDECWCVFPNGNRVEGTTMHGPKTPDCQFGSTLKKCVYLLLKNSWGVLGTYRPRCTIDGEFEDIQCFEGDCWCVDNMGIERLYTRVHKSSTPVCQATTEKTTATMVKSTPEPVNTKTNKPKDKTDRNNKGYVVDPDVHYIDPEFGLGSTPGPELEPISKPSDVDVEIGGPDETEEEDDHSSNDLSAQSESEMKILTKPFVMGAVIAGAVVGLLGAILLVMFIVYRMRKKDEGSYALEEQKFTNYSYMKAPEKEFYA
ncbi:uncharacterized protein LOC110443492 isoform X2 [Mizuhopecten yessoensis]|uniref:uncharacterized protein LOC110443492 isoform X2 n=1 Tax=Mizuhopecten yessoensis TaxID=6573 RepID=UPI000B457C80|nr:uncharacterized protein LOC110443492 isoform X2 [Mizuhopecten yessoensis]